MNNIAFYRNRAELTQEQAAKFAGWKQGRWSAYETGARTPSPEVTKTIIRVLSNNGQPVTFEMLFCTPAESAA